MIFHLPACLGSVCLTRVALESGRNVVTLSADCSIWSWTYFMKSPDEHKGTGDIHCTYKLEKVITNEQYNTCTSCLVL